MHDSIPIMSLVRTIKAVADNYRAPRVLAVNIWLGALAGLAPQTLREGFASASVATRLEGARLDITVPDDADHSDAREILILSVKLAEAQSAA
jgi:Zn finger protein HypA/HybF involved in hydrogenase expression